jgi:3-oxoacyl-[acyl-carrier protein] reductase
MPARGHSESHELADRVAIVTGANHGIGAATAIALATRGARVLVSFLRLDVPDDDPGRPPVYRESRARDGSWVADTIRRGGGRAEAIEADLLDPETSARLFDAAEASLGPVEILINNASGWRQDTFTPGRPDPLGRQSHAVTPAVFDAQFGVDARGTALLIAEFARRHVERAGSWGRIVSLTSGGPSGFSGEVSYGAAKAAAENYTMSAAWELGRYGVTANVVHPPVTDTGWVTPEIEAQSIAASPLAHIAQPEDVAEVICLVCSPRADFITGNRIQMS